MSPHNHYSLCQHSNKKKSKYLTNFLEETLLWGANRCSSVQEILHLFSNPKIKNSEECLGYLVTRHRPPLVIYALLAAKHTSHVTSQHSRVTPRQFSLFFFAHDELLRVDANSYAVISTVKQFWAPLSLYITQINFQFLLYALFSHSASFLLQIIP
jgi:hypothetical protein